MKISAFWVVVAVVLFIVGLTLLLTTKNPVISLQSGSESTSVVKQLDTTSVVDTLKVDSVNFNSDISQTFVK